MGDIQSKSVLFGEGGLPRNRDMFSKGRNIIYQKVKHVIIVVLDTTSFCRFRDIVVLDTTL